MEVTIRAYREGVALTWFLAGVEEVVKLRATYYFIMVVCMITDSSTTRW